MTRSVEVPEEAVQKAARLLFDAEWREGDWYWEQYPEPNRWQLLARQVLEAAALPYLAPAGDGGLREALAELLTDIDGNEYEHNEGCQGEPECPACWVEDLRARLDAYPAAPAVPQPVDREDLTSLVADELANWLDRPPTHRWGVARAVVRAISTIPLPAAQPVDREALEKVADFLNRPEVAVDGLSSGGQVAVINWLYALAGEQEQVEK